MKNLFKRLGERLHNGRNGTTETATPRPIDLDVELTIIRKIEADNDIDLGKRIHEFRYEELDVRLDRDIVGMYRVTVMQGKERLYSFTVVCPPKDYDALRAGYEEIAQFLYSDRLLANLPNHERLKGHYYGH